jgi:hypothetical protein
MTQAAVIGEVWSHIRDTQFGETEKSANELRHICRLEFEPPSKAHLKRVKRPRPVVVTLKPREPDLSARQHYNHVGRDALDIVAILRPNYVALKRGQLRGPIERAPALPVTPKPVEPALTSFADITAKSRAENRATMRALRSDYMIERGRTTRSLGKPCPFSTDEIVDHFGSVAHFEELCHD